MPLMPAKRCNISGSPKRTLAIVGKWGVGLRPPLHVDVDPNGRGREEVSYAKSEDGTSVSEKLLVACLGAADRRRSARRHHSGTHVLAGLLRLACDVVVTRRDPPSPLRAKRRTTGVGVMPMITTVKGKGQVTIRKSLRSSTGHRPCLTGMCLGLEWPGYSSPSYTIWYDSPRRG